MSLLRASGRRFLPALALIVAACLQPGKGKTAYVGGDLFDGTGAPILHDAVIIVAGDHIEQAGAPDMVHVPRGAKIVRLDGKWVIPGLVDAHAHASRWALSRYVAYGVTTIREMGGIQDSILALRTAVNTGATPGPRMFVSGAVLQGPPADFPGATVVRTAQDARRAVDNRTLINAHQITVFPSVDLRLLRPLLQEAKSLATPVAARLGFVDALTAAHAGVASIELMSGVVEATLRRPQAVERAHANLWRGWNAEEEAWAGLDSAALDRTARRLADTHVWIVPVLALHDAWAHLDETDYLDSLDRDAVPDSVRAAWNTRGLIRRLGLTRRTFATLRRARARQDLFLRRLFAAHGHLAVGSGSAGVLLPPGAALHREMELWVAAGLTPRDALLGATRDGARILGVDSVGVIRDGGIADFVVLNADPLADIANSRKIDFVIARGQRYIPADLRHAW